MVVMVTASGNTAAAEEAISFKGDIFPILELRCLECHQPGGSGYEASGLDLRTYEGLMKGTKFGPIVVPRNWFESNLLAVIDRRTDPALWMPHNRKPVSKCEKLMKGGVRGPQGAVSLFGAEA
jgi:hypothetical protein